MRLKLFIIVILAIFSCQRNNNPISSEIGIEEFPLAIGSTWEYIVTDTTHYYAFDDSIIVNNGILKIRILNNIILDNGKKAIIWQYNFNNKYDSVYVFRADDTTYFYFDKNTIYSDIVFVFPLTIGKEWEFEECYKYRVLEKENLNLPIGIIEEVYNVEQKYICEGEASYVSHYYIKPYVGIVKYNNDYLNYHYSIKSRIEWILRSYSIEE